MSDAPTDETEVEPTETAEVDVVHFGDPEPEPASEPDPELPGADDPPPVLAVPMPDDWWKGTPAQVPASEVVEAAPANPEPEPTLPDQLTVDLTQDLSAPLIGEDGELVDLGEPVAIGDLEPQPLDLTDEERAALPPLDIEIIDVAPDEDDGVIDNGDGTFTTSLPGGDGPTPEIVELDVDEFRAAITDGESLSDVEPVHEVPDFDPASETEAITDDGDPVDDESPATPGDEPDTNQEQQP